LLTRRLEMGGFKQFILRENESVSAIVPRAATYRWLRQ